MDVYAALPISQMADVGKGAYTEITEIVAPSSAVPGSRVDVTVRVRNNYSATIGIMVACFYIDQPAGQYIIRDSDNVAAGATRSFSGSFIMPDRDVTIQAYSYFYGTDGAWHFDDERTKDVDKAIVYEGTISRKELEYNEHRANIPASAVPEDNRGLVHIWGRNDMDNSQRMGIAWTVRNPQNTIVEQYDTWEAWPYTGSGSAHEFIGGRFDLDVPGTWRISVSLLMNPNDPKIVDSYSGTLCTVEAAVPPSEFANFTINQFDKV